MDKSVLNIITFVFEVNNLLFTLALGGQVQTPFRYLLKEIFYYLSLTQNFLESAPVKS